MAELKTKPTTQPPAEFLSQVEPEERRRDSQVLLEMFGKITGEPAMMWGSSIVGFGMYHYKSERSSQEGDWPLIAFSPRKQNLTLYAMAGNEDSQDLFARLGKHTTSKGCLYIKRLSDVDRDVLEKLIETSYRYMQSTNT